MKTNLTVDDPLANQEVTILITLTASGQPHEGRPVMVSVGVAEQMPVSKTGMLGDVSALIDEAWTAYGVRAQMAAAESETVVAEQLIATAEIEEDEPLPTTPRPSPPPPKPQARNLSLF